MIQVIFDTEKTIHVCIIIHAKHLSSKLRYQDLGIFCFFSDKKNFDLDQMINQRNNRWLCIDHKDILTVMHTKFLQGLCLSNDVDVMLAYFFPRGLRINTGDYKEMLKKVFRPWIESASKGKPFTY